MSWTAAKEKKWRSDCNWFPLVDGVFNVWLSNLSLSLHVQFMISPLMASQLSAVCLCFSQKSADDSVFSCSRTLRSEHSAPSSGHLPPHPCFPAHLSVQMFLKAVTTVRNAARPSAASTRAHQTDMSPDEASLVRTLNPKQLRGCGALQRYEPPPDPPAGGAFLFDRSTAGIPGVGSKR